MQAWYASGWMPRGRVGHWTNPPRRCRGLDEDAVLPLEIQRGGEEEPASAP